MRRFRTRTTRASAGVLGALLALAACGGTDDNTIGEGDGGGLRGSIVIDGSSTVAPVSEAIAEEFRTEQRGVQVSVGTSGTGGGFKKFCSDEIDIADASRPIKDEEKEACAASGVKFEEFRIGLDGLVVVTSAANTFVECLSIEQLREIFKQGGANTWDQVDPKFPREKIAIFAPGTDSGTYDFFVEEVLGDPKKPDSLRARTDYTASEDDNTLVQGIAGERNSWGFFGFAYFNENKAKLKAIEVSAKDGECVEPNNATVESGDYPLSRPLFIYVKKSALARPEVREFVKFYLQVTPELITDVGYAPVPEAEYERGLERLDAGS